MALAFVDLDGTLLGGRSSERRFILALARSGRLGPKQYLAALWFALSGWPHFGLDVTKKNKAYLAGLGKAEIARFAEIFVRDELLPAIRAGVVARLRREESGRRLVLLTGTPDFIAGPLAEHLGFEGVIATRCSESGGRFLARGPRRHPLGPVKLRLAAAAARRAKVALSACSAYADSRQDIALLAAVGRAIAVTPDPGLRAAALRHGWEVLMPEEPRKLASAAGRQRPAGPL